VDHTSERKVWCFTDLIINVKIEFQYFARSRSRESSRVMQASFKLARHQDFSGFALSAVKNSGA
jgi:hypothetical protein